MKGLILNNVYTVKRSIQSSCLLAIAIVIVLLIAQNDMALRAAIFLPFLLIPVHAFEVLKHDARSGWQKFEMTLPVTRKKIVTSKYVTFLLLFITSMIIVSIPFLLTHMFVYPTMNALFFNFLLRGMGLVMSIATLTFPLTYILGTEKSDTITISSVGFSLGLFFAVSLLLLQFIGSIERFDEMFSIIFFVITAVLFVTSYIVSMVVYAKKEFH